MFRVFRVSRKTSHRRKNEDMSEIPCKGTWALAGENAGGHKVYTRDDGYKIIAPLDTPDHKHTKACAVAIAAQDIKPRPASVPDYLIDRARKLLAEHDATGTRRYTYGYKYTPTEVARMLGVAPSTLGLRLQTDEGTITEQRRKEWRRRNKQRETGNEAKQE